MAVTRFDIRVNVHSPGETKGISTEDKQAIFEKPSVANKKDKEAGTINRESLRTEEEQEEELPSLEEISEAYTELVDLAEDLLTKLQERVGPLPYKFDATQEPVLAEATASVFQGSLDTITYPMYIAALRLDKDIAVALGESENGLVRQNLSST